MAVVSGGRNRAVQQRRQRHDGWTAERRAQFLKAFAATCNAGLAASAVGKCVSGARALKRRDPAFAAAWEEALEEGYRRLEGELIARALGNRDAAAGDAGDIGADGERETGKEEDDGKDDAASGDEDEDDDGEGDAAAGKAAGAAPALAPFDPELALRILQLRNRRTSARPAGRRGKYYKHATQEETDASLLRKLAALEKRLKDEA